MSITVAVRIAGPDKLGRAVMFTSAGTSLATVAGVPVGVMLSELMDWRAVFALAGIVTGLLAIALRVMLPPVPAAQVSSFRLLLDTLRRPGVGLGLSGHVLIVLGHFLAYTYIRLALERMPDVDAGTIVMLLAFFGIGGLVGNLTIGLIIDRSFRLFAALAPAVIAAAVAATIVSSGTVLGVGIAVFVWGFSSHRGDDRREHAGSGYRMPDRLEAGGSLVVVGFQGAIMIAAGVGGILVDSIGVEPSYGLGAAALAALCRAVRGVESGATGETPGFTPADDRISV